MNEFTLIVAGIASILVLGIAVAVIAWRMSRGGRLEKPNYRTFFVMGAIWLPAGILGMLLIFFLTELPLPVRFIIPLPLCAMGLVYLVVGLANRDKWRTNR